MTSQHLPTSWPIRLDDGWVVDLRHEDGEDDMSYLTGMACFEPDPGQRSVGGSDELPLGHLANIIADGLGVALDVAEQLVVDRGGELLGESLNADHGCPLLTVPWPVPLDGLVADVSMFAFPNHSGTALAAAVWAPQKIIGEDADGDPAEYMLAHGTTLAALVDSLAPRYGVTRSAAAQLVVLRAMSLLALALGHGLPREEMEGHLHPFHPDGPLDAYTGPTTRRLSRPKLHASWVHTAFHALRSCKRALAAHAARGILPSGVPASSPSMALLLVSQVAKLFLRSLANPYAQQMTFTDVSVLADDLDAEAHALGLDDPAALAEAARKLAGSVKAASDYFGTPGFMPHWPTLLTLPRDITIVPTLPAGERDDDEVN